MNMAQRFGQQSNSVELMRNEVVNEIVDSFKQVFYDGRFDNYLESRLTNDVASKRSMTVQVSFWNYSDGCSDTNFSVGKYAWKNPSGKGWDSRRYKGVELYYIQKEVGDKLLSMLLDYLEFNGFRASVENASGRLGYYAKDVIITW